MLSRVCVSRCSLHSTFTWITTAKTSQKLLLSHSIRVQACGNGHTHAHTLLVFYPLRNLEEGVRSVSGLSLALHTSSPLLPSSLGLPLLLSLLQASPLSLSFLILPVFLCLPHLSLFHSSWPPSISMLLLISLTLSPRPLCLFSPPSCFFPSLHSLLSSFRSLSSLSVANFPSLVLLSAHFSLQQ